MKGRKGNNTNVVPLTATAQDAQRFKLQGVEIARDLKPVFLDPDADMVWDRLAPSMASPLVGRLKDTTVQAFSELCYEIARLERYRVEIGFSAGDGFYTVKSRNGYQEKAKPQIAQMNQALAHAITLMRDFGMTPASERGIKMNAQADLFDDDFN